MSRRYRHGRPPQRPPRAHGEPASRPTTPTAATPPALQDPPAVRAQGPIPDASAAAYEPAPVFTAARPHLPEPSVPDATTDRAAARRSVDAPAAPMSDAPAGASAPPDPSAHAEPRPTQHAEEPLPGALPPSPSGCTTAQLRRFIKSRPWVPMHELRRRFGINGTEDDVAPVDVDGHRVFVGLPGREAAMLGELLRGGDVGVELSLDPGCPMVIGVYPMRPVPRG